METETDDSIKLKFIQHKANTTNHNTIMSNFNAIEYILPTIVIDSFNAVVPAMIIKIIRIALYAIQVGILLDVINFRIGWTFIIRCIRNGFLWAHHFCKRLRPSINRPLIVYPFALINDLLSMIYFVMFVLFGLLFEFACHILDDKTGDPHTSFDGSFVFVKLFVTRNYNVGSPPPAVAVQNRVDVGAEVPTAAGAGAGAD